MSKRTQLKVVIIGFGSIGQRHYNNLKKLGVTNLTVFDTDRKKIPKTIPQVGSLDLKTLRQFTVALITTPNSTHITVATRCAKAGCHLFIEKPLSHSLRGIPGLVDLCQKKKLITMVACNIRFHPCVQFMKKYVESGKLGKIYTMHFETGYYLPYWRPNQDSRQNYAAKKNLGGGAVLDAGIHELDLLSWFNDFSKVQRASLVTTKVSDLQIETEDAGIATFMFANKRIGSVRCDYLQRRYGRTAQIVGQYGTLEYDYLQNTVWLGDQKGKCQLFTMKKYDINNFYLDEFKYFLGQLEKGRKTFNSISDGATVLSYALKGYEKK